MEKMPYRVGMEMAPVPIATTTITTSDWQRGLPALRGDQVVLRDLRQSDAASLFALLTTEEVARFISPPPTSIEDFEKFITWAMQQRLLGTYVCFAVTLRGFDTAIGIFQVRDISGDFDTAEWGFAIGSAFWGTGVFEESAELVMQFTFETIGVHRLEARAAVQNGRGNGALQKIGCVQECVLRKSFLCHGRYLDQVLYAMVDVDWRRSREVRRVQPMLVH
jgi:RimJ/RimL family protein N-acetyltransferase